MIIWDTLRESQISDNKKFEYEEAIDLSNDFGDVGVSTVSIDTFPVEQEKKEAPLPDITPFPWPVDKLCEELDKLILGEECQELEDVIIFTSQRIYN